MYILQVTPLITLPGPLSQSLSYSHHEFCFPGHVVTVHVHNRYLTGFVISCQPFEEHPFSSEITLKPITEILSPIPLLTPEQISLAQWISNTYGSSLGRILKLFHPRLLKRIKRYPKVLNQQSESKTKTSEFQLAPIVGSYKQRLEFYLQYIKTSPGQIVIICPDHITLTRLSQDLYSLQPVVITSDLPTTEYRSRWMQVKLGKAHLVLSLRTGLFLPFHDLSQVIVENETADGHQSKDRKPHFHSGDIAAQLAWLHQARYTPAGLLPRFQTTYLLHNHGLSWIPETFPNLQNQKSKIFSMTNEFRRGNTSPLSQPVQTTIQQALDTQFPILIYVNRRGDSTAIRCRDCGHYLRDPHSGSLLVSHRTDVLTNPLPNYHKSIVLVSHKSHRWFRMPDYCPHCKSPELHHGGIGIEKIEREIAHLFPSSSYALLSSDHVTDLSDQRQIVENFISGKTSILITTKLIEKFIPDLPPHLTIIPSAEGLLQFPAYSTIEQALPVLSNLITSSTSTLIQRYQDFDQETENPPLIDTLLHSSLNNIYTQEYQDRETYHYPPFYQLLAIHSSHGNRQKSLAMAKNTKASLRQAGYQPLGPLESFSSQGRGQFVMTLILKQPHDTAWQLKQIILPLLGRDQELEINPQNM